MISNLFASKDILKGLNKVLKILPGLIVCVIIAWIGKYIGNYVPSIGGASIAIFIVY